MEYLATWGFSRVGKMAFGPEACRSWLAFTYARLRWTTSWPKRASSASTFSASAPVTSGMRSIWACSSPETSRSSSFSILRKWPGRVDAERRALEVVRLTLGEQLDHVLEVEQAVVDRGGREE